MLNIEQQKARKILKALIYQDLIDEDNKESRGEKINYEKPLIKEFTKFCGLSDDELDDLYEEVHNNIDEFENNTFWQGVDVPGKALECVVITKLPFSVPDDPMIEARMELIESRKGNPFLEYQVPQAIMIFKQGFGRLIRTKSDMGIVAVLDPRVKIRYYGRLFIDALPECKHTFDISEVKKFFSIMQANSDKNIKDYEKQPKAYSVEEIRRSYPKAYVKWSKDEDDRLKSEYMQGKDILELANTFQREVGAIRSRLQKMDLSK